MDIEEFGVNGNAVLLNGSHPDDFSTIPQIATYTSRSGYETPDIGSEIPGFALQPRHIGVQAYQSHAVEKKDRSFASDPQPIHKPVMYSSAYFAARRSIYRKKHLGTVDAWNRKGQRADQKFNYWVASESSTEVRTVAVSGGGGGV